MADLKVDTDIIISIAASPTVMYVEIFKTGVIVFIGDIKMCLTSHWRIIFNIRVSSCACELRTDLIFLWIKVSSVIQTLSAAHIKGKISKYRKQNQCCNFYLFQQIPFCYSNIFLKYFCRFLKQQK